LNDKPTLQDLLEIQQHFSLPSPALVYDVSLAGGCGADVLGSRDGGLERLRRGGRANPTYRRGVRANVHTPQ
jgi:hypothetical protein